VVLVGLENRLKTNPYFFSARVVRSPLQKKIKDKLMHFFRACGPWSTQKSNKTPACALFQSLWSAWSTQKSDKRQTRAFSHRKWSTSKIDKRQTQALSQWSVVCSENRLNKLVRFLSACGPRSTQKTDKRQTCALSQRMWFYEPHSCDCQ
jgi:hypothetical protein